MMKRQSNSHAAHQSDEYRYVLDPSAVSNLDIVAMMPGDSREPCHAHVQTQLRRLQILRQHLSSLHEATQLVVQFPCRASASHPEAKVSKAADAIALIPDSAVITVRTALQGCDDLHQQMTRLTSVCWRFFS